MSHLARVAGLLSAFCILTFILISSYDDADTLFVNDPGFNTTSYSYATDVVGYRIFDMKA